MKDWCLQHPYMTFVLALFVIASATSVLNQLLSLFKKPDPPPTVNMKVELPNDYDASSIDIKETLN